MRRKHTEVVLPALLVLAVMAAIFFFSAQPADESGRLSTGVVRFLLHLFLPGYDDMTAAEVRELYRQLGFWVRKAAHFAEFAALGFAWRLLLDRFRCDGLAAMLCAWLLSTLYAVTDEVHQMFVDGRAPAVRDVCIDSAGSICGVLVMALLLWLIRRRRQRWVYR